MHDHVFRALACFECATDQVFACLYEDLDGDIVRNHIVLNDFANKVEVGLRGGWEADFDFLVTHVDQQVKHAALTLRAHWVDECLVAIAKVYCAPLWRLSDAFLRPSAVGEIDVFYFDVKRLVSIYCHGGIALSVPWSLTWCFITAWGDNGCRGGDESIWGGH